MIRNNRLIVNEVQRAKFMLEALFIKEIDNNN